MIYKHDGENKNAMNIFKGGTGSSKFYTTSPDILLSEKK